LHGHFYASNQIFYPSSHKSFSSPPFARKAEPELQPAKTMAQPDTSKPITGMTLEKRGEGKKIYARQGSSRPSAPSEREASLFKALKRAALVMAFDERAVRRTGQSYQSRRPHASPTAIVPLTTFNSVAAWEMPGHSAPGISFLQTDIPQPQRIADD
jgi:hypothetical protein